MGAGLQNSNLSFSELYGQARQAMPELHQYGHNFLESLKQKYPHKFDGVIFEQAPLKDEKRALAKVDGDYDGDHRKIADLVRGRLVVQTPEQIEIIRKELQSNKGALGIEKLKDLYAEPLDSHFRSINMKVRMPNGHISEFRIDQRDMVLAADSNHKRYEEIQAIERKAQTENRPMTDSEAAKRRDLLTLQRQDFDRAAKGAGLDNLLNDNGRTILKSHGYVFPHQTRVGAGVGVGMGVYNLSQKLGENGTATGDLKDDKTRKLAQTGIAADVAAIGVDSAEGLATLTKVSKGLESASRISRVAAPVAATLSVASGVIEYKIAEKKGDGQRAAEAVGSTAGGLTGAIAGGVAGAKGGAIAGATIGAFFGGVGAAPGAAIGGFIGGIAGAVGGGWAGAEGGKAVSREVLTDTFQKQFDEQQPAAKPKRSEQSRQQSLVSREASNQPNYVCDYSPYSPTLSATPAKDFAASAPDLGKHFKVAAFGDALNEAKFATPNADYPVQNRHVSAGQRLGL